MNAQEKTVRGRGNTKTKTAKLPNTVARTGRQNFENVNVVKKKKCNFLIFFFSFFFSEKKNKKIN